MCTHEIINKVCVKIEALKQYCREKGRFKVQRDKGPPTNQRNHIITNQRLSYPSSHQKAKNIDEILQCLLVLEETWTMKQAKGSYLATINIPS